MGLVALLRKCCRAIAFPALIAALCFCPAPACSQAPGAKPAGSATAARPAPTPAPVPAPTATTDKPPSPAGWTLWDMYSAVANAASILALFASGYAAVQIRRVQARFVGRVQLPQIIGALQRNGATMAEKLRDFDNQTLEFEEQVALCEANLKTASRHAKEARPAIKQVRAVIQAFEAGSPQKDVASGRAVYRQLQGLIQELSKLLEERQLRGS
jgi:hypothetical protein